MTPTSRPSSPLPGQDSTRRRFLAHLAAAGVALASGVRGAVAQPAAAVRRFLMQGPPGTETLIDGRRFLYFGGTSYYTLQHHPDLLKAAHEAIDAYGMHSATSRGGFGNTPLYVAVEQTASRFFGTEDAAYVASGYLSNVAAIQCLHARKLVDAIFVDAIAHYSLADFAPVPGVRVVTFAHRDPDDLARKLRTELRPGQKPLVISDGIFPVPGEIAPVPDYVKAVLPYDGAIWLDDAHALGVLGANGRGTCEHFGLAGERLFFGGTLSKAIGGYGGIIPARAAMAREIRDGHVMNGATMPPSATAAASVKGMELLMAHPEWRERLRTNARRLKRGLSGLGIRVTEDEVPIAAFALETGRDMERVHTELMNRGICIQLSHYIGAGAEGVLRAVVFSTHTPEQIDRLVGELKRII